MKKEAFEQAPSAPGESPRVAWRVALMSVVGFWAFYFLINTLHMAIEGKPNQFLMMEKRGAVILSGMALTLFVLLVLRSLEDKSLGVLIATAFLTAIPVAGAYATLNFTAFYVVDPLPEHRQEIKTDPEKPWEIILETAVSWYFFVVAWAILYIALSYAAKVRYAERNAARYRAEAQVAQLRALRYQINPHFLFNTLNSLSTLILRHRNEEAERMIMNLATFFRTSLTADPADDVLLGEEIRMQRLYLDIEEARFPDRLTVVIDVPPDLENVYVPGLILQPAVENAIKHGVARSMTPVTLVIRARLVDHDLLLTVEDDGNAVGEAPPGQGVGLRNVRDRLTARFDGAAACSYGPTETGGFKVEIRVPLMHEALAAQ
ncbi:MAG TPA: histidine kinase [Alphaproteobacteria bacterium]|nr:histidine kinase [Alphaproteobacteria bacterium]